MTPPSFDDGSYRGPELPRALGDQLGRVLHLEDRPRVFADWVDALAALAERESMPVDPDTLCTTDASPHRARFDGDEQHYRCVQDPIVLPFLDAGVDAVAIETRSPIRDDPVSLEVTRDAIDADPAGTTFSFGVAADVDGPDPGDVRASAVYPLFCPFGHAFPTRDTYEAWASTVDAYTMPASPADTHEWARALGAIAA